MPFIGGGGIAGYNIFALAGMNISGAAHGALMFATVPLMTAVANAVRTRTMPSIATLACVVAAFLGIALVITGGDPAVLARGGSVIGDGLLLLGSVAWVTYTIERAKYPTFSALRFTSLTMITGELVIAIAAVVAMIWLRVGFPAGSELRAADWLLVYGGIVPVVVAMLLQPRDREDRPGLDRPVRQRRPDRDDRHRGRPRRPPHPGRVCRRNGRPGRTRRQQPAREPARPSRSALPRPPADRVAV